MYISVKDKLMLGQPVIAAGSWGSELVRRGVALDARLWTARANLDQQEIIRGIAADYTRAGADVLIANTFSTGPLLMSALDGLGDMEEADRAAVRLAREGMRDVEGEPPALAGSFSAIGSLRHDRNDLPDLPHADMVRIFRNKAQSLASAGCDMIYMERLGGLTRALAATEAAVETGLPVWAEVAVKREADGVIRGVGSCRWKIEDIVSELMNAGAVACLISHEQPDVIADSLSRVCTVWAGPQGASIKNGGCEMPEWCNGGLTPEDVRIEARRWRRQKAGIFALNAGTGPEHVAALKDLFRERDKDQDA